MTISPEALEKGRAITHMFCLFPPSDKQALEIQIAAALQAERDAAAPKLPDDLAGLVERLNGVYRVPITDGLGAVGSGEEPDNPNEFVQRFETPPIQKEAAAAIQSLAARNAELEMGMRGLLDCPDIADNDYNDEETHAAERVARSLLNKDRQP